MRAFHLNSKVFTHFQSAPKNTYILASNESDLAQVKLFPFDDLMSSVTLSKSATQAEVRIIYLLQDIPLTRSSVLHLNYAYSRLSIAEPFKWVTLLSLAPDGTLSSLQKPSPEMKSVVDGIATARGQYLVSDLAVQLKSTLVIAFQMSALPVKAEVLAMSVEDDAGIVLTDLSQIFLPHAKSEKKKVTAANKSPTRLPEIRQGANERGGLNSASKSQSSNHSAVPSVQAAPIVKKPVLGNVIQKITLEPLDDARYKSKKSKAVGRNFVKLDGATVANRSVHEIAALISLFEASRTEWEAEKAIIQREADQTRIALDQAHSKIAELLKIHA